MERMPINKEDLEQWINETRIMNASQTSKITNDRITLHVTLRTEYIVERGGLVEYRGRSIVDAILAFNNLI